MKTKNICKFISEHAYEKLDIQNFIYETDILTMNQPKILKYNRIILVKQGSFIFHISGAQIKADTGSLIFAFTGENFCAAATAYEEYLYIDFSGDRADVLFRRLGINKGNRVFDEFDGLIPFWMESLTRASHDNIDLVAESILLYSMSKINTAPNKQSTLVQQIINITEENFDNPDLSISTIAKDLSYNTKYISHYFKQKMGVGYTEYLRIYRINYAIMLLDHGIDSVKNIASLCGFSNPMYFSAVFKQIIGVSPSEYNGKQSG